MKTTESFLSKWLTVGLLLIACGCAAESSTNDYENSPDEIGDDQQKDDKLAACTKATAAQLAQVNLGNTKRDRFLQECARATNGSSWCEQLTRPNPDSRSIFSCTYGANQVHQLIHPTESTWKNAFEAVQIIKELQAKSLGISLIYNWWRPEPYNKNVGGAAGRHPLGTSIDVRFASQKDKDAAFIELCRMRRQGRVRAVGYYPTTALHFGVGDKTGNTWGKACP